MEKVLADQDEVLYDYALNETAPRDLRRKLDREKLARVHASEGKGKSGRLFVPREQQSTSELVSFSDLSKYYARKQVNVNSSKANSASPRMDVNVQHFLQDHYLN